MCVLPGLNKLSAEALGNMRNAKSRDVQAIRVSVPFDASVADKHILLPVVFTVACLSSGSKAHRNCTSNGRCVCQSPHFWSVRTLAVCVLCQRNQKSAEGRTMSKMKRTLLCVVVFALGYTSCFIICELLPGFFFIRMQNKSVENPPSTCINVSRSVVVSRSHDFFLRVKNLEILRVKNLEKLGEHFNCFNNFHCCRHQLDWFFK